MKRICVFCGSSPGNCPEYRAAAEELGTELVRRNIGLVYGGGNVGLMGVLADAVLKAGGEAVGVIPENLMAREVGHNALTKLHVVHSMHERKALMPSEYNREVFGGDLSEAVEFSSLDEAQEILNLMMRHWNTIAGTLHKGEVYVPLLLEDDRGVAHGNDWAHGFMRGMQMRHDGWGDFVNDDEHGGCLIPVMMLHHEHDEDPEMRPDPITPEHREEVIVHMAAGLSVAHKYFRKRQEAYAQTPTVRHTPSHRTPRIGRNDPCPCGSGKKYKTCCGGATVN